MSCYAIGDLQGCHLTLMRLLARISFDPTRDRLWLAGDLVNRGPDSLAVLRWAFAHRHAVTAVLGNHDLRCLSIAYKVKEARPSDTLGPLLAAPDAPALLGWLQALPLMHVEGAHALVHAGMVPTWSVAEAAALAGEVQAALAGPQAKAFLAHLSQETVDTWTPSLTGLDRLIFITKAFTYMRICQPDGRLLLDFAAPPQKAPPGFLPWYAVPNRRSLSHTVICGHWSALGLHLDHNIRALDTGCVWGGHLTAYRLEDGEVFQEPAAETRP
ncbi:MAG TPA: symmetrical bis(5'-nucleosyl)-tetraphosphatase [Myxococcota bacterium]|nr:symmetrical bis(5'-nucleosyl)-tetraphosphatase [Myxococcota bacterium]